MQQQTKLIVGLIALILFEIIVLYLLTVIHLQIHCPCRIDQTDVACLLSMILFICLISYTLYQLLKVLKDLISLKYRKKRNGQERKQS